MNSSTLNHFLVIITLAINTIFPSINSDISWSPTVLITSKEAMRWTKIIADNTSLLHAFWVSPIRGDTTNVYTAQYHSIFLANSNGNNQWSEPTNIIFDARPINGLSVVSVGNTYHVFWNSDCIHHSYVDLKDINNPWKWLSTETCIASPSYPESFDVAVDQNNNDIILVYSTGSVLKIQSSSDNGVDWSFPVTVAEATDVKGAIAATYPKVTISTDGILLIVWTAVSSEMHNNSDLLGVFFTRSTDGGKTWLSPPYQIGDAGEGQANIIALDKTQVHVIWNSRVGTSERFHRWSADNGSTWSDKEIILNRVQGGYTGIPGLISDQNNQVLTLLGTDSGVRFMTWINGKWTQPVNFGSTHDGETWTTGLVWSGMDKVCAYWNASRPVMRIAITCKGKTSESLPTITYSNRNESALPKIKPTLPDSTLMAKSSTPKQNNLSQYSSINSSDQLTTSLSFPLIVSGGLVNLFLFLFLFFVIRGRLNR